MRTLYQSGKYVASEGSVESYSARYTPDATHRAVMYWHGVNGLGISFWAFSQHVLRALTENGAPVFSGDMGGQALWGNDTTRDRGPQARTWMNANMGSKTDKVILVAESAGFVGAARYAQANPTHVAALVGLCPVAGLLDVYNNNRGGYAASISTAHVGAPPSAADPSTFGAYLVGIPQKLWVADNDTIATAAAAQTFAALSGATIASLGAVGHDPTLVPAADVVAFLAPYFVGVM